MKTNIGRLAIVAVLASLATGCFQTKRYVTTQGWKDGDVAYFAYTEVTGPSSSAKVLKCSRRDDNTLKCTEQQALNAFLNK
jgi:hypothetical protein